MKKIFTLLLFASVASLNAQTPGYNATSIYDDFGTSTDYAETNPVDPNTPEGAYWWGKPALGNSGSNTSACNASNKYVLTRTGNKKLDVVVSQGDKCWEPMGISTKLDLSANAKFEVSVTNTSSYPLYFDIALVDVNKKVINCDADGKNFNVLSIAANETKIFSGDFTGGQHKTWPGPTYTTGLDFTKVIEIDFTIVNADQPESNGWEPLAITDATITLNYFKIGNLAGVGINDITEKNTISVYPNPTNASVITFSQQLQNIKLYNTVGQLILSSNSTSKLDISSLSQGIYVLTSTEGSTKLIVQ